MDNPKLLTVGVIGMLISFLIVLLGILKLKELG
jgi:hypothetical protein